MVFVPFASAYPELTIEVQSRVLQEIGSGRRSRTFIFEFKARRVASYTIPDRKRTSCGSAAGSSMPHEYCCGSAAGCEARLRLAGGLTLASGLCPWFGLSPISLGQRPYQGQSPNFSLKLYGEA